MCIRAVYARWMRSRSTCRAACSACSGRTAPARSTLMRCVASLLIPTSGTIRFGDIDVVANPAALRRTLGYLPQDFGVYPRVSAYEMLDHMAVLKGISRRGERRADGRGAAAAGQPVGRPEQRAGRVLGRHAPAVRHRAGADRQPHADDRRRADRRSRSRGAEPLPESARRDRRERRRHPLDAHRRRRVGPVPADGDHRVGTHRAGRRAARPRRASSKAASGARRSTSATSKRAAGSTT